jgi:4-amino-4-deoxy-L-arabinose transferase-like glycosyltransferase
MRSVLLVAVLSWLVPATAAPQVLGDPTTSSVQALGLLPVAAAPRAIHAPDLAARLAAETRARSHWRTGAIAGFVIGAGATYLVLHSGGSTATCDRERNQDAIGARECAAITVGGGLAGAGLGAVIGSQIRVRR